MLDHGAGNSRVVLKWGRIPEGRRVLDLAEGILIGLRRYSPEAAFGELLAVAHRNDITVSAAAATLVGLATGFTDAADFHPEIAQQEWGSLLPAAAG